MQLISYQCHDIKYYYPPNSHHCISQVLLVSAHVFAGAPIQVK